MNTKITNGNSGGDVISNTSATTPTQGESYGMVQAINTDVVMDAGCIGTPDISSKTIGAGVVIAGKWTSLTRASGGDLIAYFE
jgi:hypothetical protein